MADDKSFKELIAEQKRTNRLLEAQARSDAEGSNLKASIKNSAGEIINDRLIGQTAKEESDQTQVKVSGVTSATYEVSEEQNEDSTTQERHEELVAAVNESGGGDADFFSPSQIKEQNKDKEKSLAKAIGIGFLKGMGGLLAGLKKLNPLKGNVGSFLSTLLKLGAGGIALIALKNFLESDNWKNMKENMIPALVRIFNFLSKIFKNVVFRFDKLIKDYLDPEKSMTQVITDNATTILGFVAAFYARTILAFGAALALGVVGVGKYTGFGAFFRSVLFGKQKGKGLYGGAKGVAKRLGLVGVIITLFEGVVRGLLNAFKDDADPTKITSNFGLITTIPAFLAVELYATIRDLILFGIGLISPKMKKRLQEQVKANPEDDKKLIQKLADSIDLYYDTLMSVVRPILALNNYFADKLAAFAQKSVSFLKFFGIDLNSDDQNVKEEKDKLSKIRKDITASQKVIDRVNSKEGKLSAFDLSKIAEEEESIKYLQQQENKQLQILKIRALKEAGLPVNMLNGKLLTPEEFENQTKVPTPGKEEMSPEMKALEKAIHEGAFKINIKDLTYLKQQKKLEDIPKENTLSLEESQMMGKENPVVNNINNIIDAKNQSNNASTYSVIRASVEPDIHFLRQAGWAI